MRFRKKWRRIVMFCCLCLLSRGDARAQSTSASSSALPATSSLAFARAKHLRRGINLSEWFAQVYDKRGYTREHFETWTTAEDVALIKSMGFDHVRLSVNPQPMFTMNQPQKLPS